MVTYQSRKKIGYEYFFYDYSSSGRKCRETNNKRNSECAGNQNGPLLEKTAQKPNIIILYADDMGFGDLGIQNPDSKIPTPNLDKLAEQGMRFTDGHSSSGICTPSRYAMQTGRYHWRDFHGIVGPMVKPCFKENQYTMAQMFKEKMATERLVLANGTWVGIGITFESRIGSNRTR